MAKTRRQRKIQRGGQFTVGQKVEVTADNVHWAKGTIIQITPENTTTNGRKMTSYTVRSDANPSDTRKFPKELIRPAPGGAAGGVSSAANAWAGVSAAPASTGVGPYSTGAGQSASTYYGTPMNVNTESGGVSTTGAFSAAGFGLPPRPFPQTVSAAAPAPLPSIPTYGPIGPDADVVRYVISAHGGPSTEPYKPPPNFRLAFFTRDGIILDCPNVLQTKACLGTQDGQVKEWVPHSRYTKNYELSKDFTVGFVSGAVDCTPGPDGRKSVVYDMKGFSSRNTVTLRDVMSRIKIWHDTYYSGQKAIVYCLFCRGGDGSNRVEPRGRKTRKARKSRKSRR